MSRDELSSLADQIETVVEDPHRFNIEPGFEIRPRSACVQENAAMLGETGPTGRWVQGYAPVAAQMAWLLLQAAVGHFAGAAAILRCDRPMFAMAPVIRSMFEAMGQAAWLLDPAIPNVRIRAARTLLQLSGSLRCWFIGMPNRP